VDDGIKMVPAFIGSIAGDPATLRAMIFNAAKDLRNFIERAGGKDLDRGMEQVLFFVQRILSGRFQ